MPKAIDIAGKRFGRLIVIGKYDKDKFGQWIWACKCDCGKDHHVLSSNLRRGLIKSCGCLNKELVSARSLKHGYADKIPEYGIWLSMRKRCLNKNDQAYNNYGGRSIDICEHWESFSNFLEDMGVRPNSTLTIERVNNDKGYSPKNCKWATRKEQRANQRPRKNQISFIASKNGKTFISNNQQLFSREHNLSVWDLNKVLHRKKKQVEGWSISQLGAIHCG